MRIDQVEQVYFVGIGGIGMSALARYFIANSLPVAGYDRAPSAITDALIELGAFIHFEDNVDLIPEQFRDKKSTLVIYTPAISEGHAELSYFISNEFVIQKRAAVLGTIANPKQGVAVAGTHGKTSVSTILASILNDWNDGCSAFLGGVSKNFANNFIASSTSDLVVLEADEFDRSFLQLTPRYAIITSLDPDHLDIYGSFNNLIKSFEQFITLIKRGGVLLINEKVRRLVRVPDYIKVFTYSINESANYRALNVTVEDGEFSFDAKLSDYTQIEHVKFGLPGRINVENALAALSMATIIGVDHETIKNALRNFKGVARRFDYQIKSDAVTYIDDYAHHPEEISTTLNSVRELYPNKKITGIFQPHLFSRTSDFASDFAESLSLLDELFLLDIYPAREEPIPGVTSRIIYDDVSLKNKTLCSKEELCALLEKSDVEVLLTLGAGDIDKTVAPIKEMLLKKYRVAANEN